MRLLEQRYQRWHLVSSVFDAGSGVFGQAVRFVVTGSMVAVAYLGTTTALADIVGLYFQLALAIGFCCGLVIQFTLQRFFVWNHRDGFALPIHQQAARYLMVAGSQYGLTVASTAVLPAAFGLSTELVYVVTVATLVVVNFLVFRNRVFHSM